MAKLKREPVIQGPKRAKNPHVFNENGRCIHCWTRDTWALAKKTCPLPNGIQGSSTAKSIKQLREEGLYAE